MNAAEGMRLGRLLQLRDMKCEAARRRLEEAQAALSEATEAAEGSRAAVNAAAAELEAFRRWRAADPASAAAAATPGYEAWLAEKLAAAETQARRDADVQARRQRHRDGAASILATLQARTDNLRKKHGKATRSIRLRQQEAEEEEVMESASGHAAAGGRA